MLVVIKACWVRSSRGLSQMQPLAAGCPAKALAGATLKWGLFFQCCGLMRGVQCAGCAMCWHGWQCRSAHVGVCWASADLWHALQPLRGTAAVSGCLHVLCCWFRHTMLPRVLYCCVYCKHQLVNNVSHAPVKHSITKGLRGSVGPWVAT
jgi:hypothetical protein